MPKGPYVYQIYGDSDLYGRNCLLYIGQTNVSKGKNNRPYKHQKDKEINNFSVRYALCPEDELNIIEALLNATQKPSYNEKCISNSEFLNSEELFMIFNEGERGQLLLEISNMYWR